MPHKFKAANLDKLDNPKRREILPPYKVIEMIDVKRGQIIADVGCGIGYFSIPMAKVVGEEGKIYAVDISVEMLKELKRRAGKEDVINNIEVVGSTENDFKLEKESVDMVFTATVFHEVDSPEKFLTECERVMKSSGTLIILDWNRVEEEFGPPINKRKDVNEVKNDIVNCGFHISSEDYIGKSFYLLTCKKN